MTLTEQYIEDEAALLPQPIPSPAETEPSSSAVLYGNITKSQALNLYTSHLLSTWNARTYEFAAVRPLPPLNYQLLS